MAFQQPPQNPALLLAQLSQPNGQVTPMQNMQTFGTNTVVLPDERPIGPQVPMTRLGTMGVAPGQMPQMAGRVPFGTAPPVSGVPGQPQGGAPQGPVPGVVPQAPGMPAPAAMPQPQPTAPASFGAQTRKG